MWQFPGYIISFVKKPKQTKNDNNKTSRIYCEVKITVYTNQYAIIHVIKKESEKIQMGLFI